jgi:hypothetical protein
MHHSLSSLNPTLSKMSWKSHIGPNRFQDYSVHTYFAVLEQRRGLLSSAACDKKGIQVAMHASMTCMVWGLNFNLILLVHLTATVGNSRLDF